MVHKNNREECTGPKTFPSQLSAICFLSFWPQESATVFLPVVQPQEKWVRDPSLACALMDFTCVPMVVKATLLGGEKYESESLSYVPVSTLPPLTFFKTPGDAQTSC